MPTFKANMHVLTRWDQELTPEQSSDIFLNLALWEVAAIDDPMVSEVLTSALLQGDYREVIDYHVDYASLSRNDSQRIRQVQAYYAKRSDLDLGYDRLAVAERKFEASEEVCRESNEVFRLRVKGKFQFFPRVERVLWHASRKIHSILGDIPRLSDLNFRFGPGATTQLPKRMASARAKLGQTPACSSELFPIAHLVLAEMPLWLDSLTCEGPQPRGHTPVVLNPGKVAFVPKSAKEDRTIMVEPLLNTMCQAGIGSYMAARLRRCGVDIRDQTRNQRLARKGSIDGSLATIDLSSASDTISTELVFDLLGVDWASFLNRFRTGTATYKGASLRLEKFSSMGNGFTFPLETLIFYALAFGCAVESGAETHDVSAYGDDIILPVGACSLLFDVFAACGFEVNKKKSYTEGPFRESCGADYFQGIDIRPVYQKTGPRTCDLFRIHNFFYRNCDSSVCDYLASYIDPTIRIFGPDGYGDGHLLGEWVPAFKKSHLRKGYGGRIFDTFTFRSRRSFRASRGDRVLPAYSVYVTENSHDRTQLKGSDVRYGRGGEGDFSVSVPGYSGVNRISIYTYTT